MGTLIDKGLKLLGLQRITKDVEPVIAFSGSGDTIVTVQDSWGRNIEYVETEEVRNRFKELIEYRLKPYSLQEDFMHTHSSTGEPRDITYDVNSENAKNVELSRLTGISEEELNNMLKSQISELLMRKLRLSALGVFNSPLYAKLINDINDGEVNLPSENEIKNSDLPLSVKRRILEEIKV
jgi:hypothetical protein